MRTFALFAAFVSVASIAACAARQRGPAGPGIPAPATQAEQLAAGEKIFGERCAGCHGATLQGGKGPELLGHALDEFITAQEAFTYVKNNMPPEGNALADTDAWAVTAFVLQKNGVGLGEAPVSAENASKITWVR
jgi:mono/diheme cytochrome c family protein